MVYAALQQTLVISPGFLSNPMLGGRDPTAVLEVQMVLGANAALQQTLFIVSSSPSNPMLGGGDPIAVLEV